MTTTASMSWLLHDPNPHADLHLVCLPYSGAPSTVFDEWRVPGVDLLPVVLPGRGPRKHEPLPTSLRDLAAGIVENVIDQLPGRYAILGHSMGAWLAHAVATMLTERGSPEPEQLILLSAPPPHVRTRRFSSLHTLSDTEMVDQVIMLGGAPESARETIAANVDVIRADATAVGHYRPSKRVLSCPITLAAGGDDPLFPTADLTAWRESTTGDVSLRFVDGGHFIVNTQRHNLSQLVARNTGAATRHTDPIAVIGMGLRFPGANNPREFWSLLADGRDAIRPAPHDRVTNPFQPIMKVGGFLRDVDQFDAAHFRISPREAHRADPRLRLLLMTTQEAIDDAALTPEAIAGERTGIWVGESHSDYWDLSTPEVTPNMYTLSGGGLKSFLSGRVSHAFDLQGPSITLDTSCSSSLTAIHTATQALRNGEVDTALAAGTHLILNPDGGPSHGLAKALSPHGRSAFASTDADGYARGEGVATIILKRLSDAVASNDPIYAVLEGSAVNANGQSGRNIVTTSVPGQVRMMRRALVDAATRPEDIGYVEAHGPGTPVGDAVELDALDTVYGHNPHPCLIGSVKTNVGHLEPSAGIAGFIKTALAVHNSHIPASLHHKEPANTLDWGASALDVPTTLTPWPVPGHRRAAVSSFGLSGANAHTIVAAPPVQINARTRPAQRSWNLRRFWYTEVQS